MEIHRSAGLLFACFLLFLSSGRAFAQTVNAGSNVNICPGGPTTLGGSPTASGGQPPYTYTWSPATGLSSTSVANPVCTATGTTTYTVSVEDGNPATPPVTDQVTVTINTAPTIALTSPNAELSTTYNGLPAFSLCQQGFAQYDFQFTDASTAAPGSTFSITWGNGNTGSYNAAGWSSTQQYQLGLTQGTYTITAPNGCSTTTAFYVFIGGVPLGGLSVVTGTSICTGQSISFQWNNIGTNPPGTSYIIEFGDGQTSTVPHPPPAVIQHTYDVSSCENGGEFSAAWRIQNPCDIRTGNLDQIRVSESPVADFTASPNDTACVQSTVTFSDQSLGAQAPNCANPKHLWSITPLTYSISSGTLGNAGATPNNPALWNSGSPSLSVQFLAPGTYTISDITGNVCGRDTLVRTICVEAPPQPAFTLSPAAGCTPLVSTVDNTSSSPNSCRTRYAWSAAFNSGVCNSTGTATFSGGTSSASFEPQFTFTGAGAYTVTLQAINTCGTYPVNVPVTVGAPPQVTLQPVSGICAGQSVSPSATFTACGSPITGTTWSLPGGSPSSSTNAVPGTITYPAQGNYTITATATSACGPTNATAPLAVTTLPPAPTVGGPISLCAGQTLALTAGTIAGATYHWTGPNGFDSALQDPTIPNVGSVHQGTYTVTASSGGCSGPPAQVQVTVNVAPVVSISPSAPSICAGGSVTLNASGAGNYQWTTGGGPTGSGPTFTFTPAGTTTVGLTGDLGGCPSTATTTVIVNTPPIVNAGPDLTFCDQPEPEPLSPPTPGGTWSGDPQVTPGGIFTPNGTGTFTLTYSVTNSANCTGSDVITVTVDPPPPPADAGNDTLLCEGSVPLQLAGSPAGGTWSGSGITSAGLFTPGADGNFTVTYAVGAGSCASSDALTINVVEATPVDAGIGTELCIDAAAVTLAGAPVGGSWSGTGLTGNTFDPAAAGTGPHVLTYTFTDPNGCTGQDALTITVDPLPVVDVGSDVVFCDQPFEQVLPSSPPGGTWSGPVVTPDGHFTPAGIGTFTLLYAYTDANGCSEDDDLLVTVVAITDPATAGNDTAVCMLSGTFALAGSPAGGTWSGPHVDATGVFTPTTDGVFTLTYSQGTGTCITQDQVDVTVHPLPQPTITSSTDICLDDGPQAVTATPVGGTWSGTGITDPIGGLFDPAVSGPGGFTLTYTYTDANGCTNDVQGIATVNPLPTAGFTHDPIACANAPFPFTDASSGATGWAWDFGDGLTGSGPSPVHTYTTPGTYTVVQTASTGAGCTATATGSVTVWEGPAVTFSATPTEGCGPLTVDLLNGSSGDGVTYAWDLGNSTGSSAEQPGSIIYPNSAYDDTTYTVTLTATNLCASVTATEDITVHPPPTAFFGPDFDIGCSPWPVTFSNVSIGNADEFIWDFGDGTGANTLDSLVYHTYSTGPNDTTFTITLTATNACGTDLADYTVTVLPNTIIAFFNTDTTSGCAPLTVEFTQYSIGVTNWHWDLGDGNVSTAHDVTHTYAAGTWTATLFGDNGCSYDTVRVTIHVDPSPAVTFDAAPQPACAGTPIHFTQAVADAAGTAWDFGDGILSDLGQPVHTFPGSGTWPVTLTVTGTNGCVGSNTMDVEIAPVPVADLSVSEPVFCTPATLVFTNLSTGSDLAATWYLDGAVASFLFDPLPQVISAPGPHSIGLYVVDQLTGCHDSTGTALFGNATPEAAFVLQPIDHCQDPVQVDATSTATPGAAVGWWLNDALVGTTAQLHLEVEAPGTFELQLVAELQGPCTDTSTTVFELEQLPIADFTTDTSCVGQSIPIHDASQHFTGQWWYFNGSLVSTSASTAAMVPTDQGLDTVAVAVINATGCRDSLELIMRSHATPIAAFTYEIEDDCRSIRFSGGEVGNGTYAWYQQSADVPWSVDREPLFLYDAETDRHILFTMTVTNIEGCTDTTMTPLWLPTCVYVPNAFTPDGDQINDTYYPWVLASDAWEEFFVFDRWGEVIYKGVPGSRPWDGRVNGQEAPPGVYPWKLKLRATDGSKEPIFGHVTLVR